MPTTPLIFSDHFLSVYQSAIADKLQSGLAAVTSAAVAGNVMHAATEIAALTDQKQPVPTTAPPGCGQQSWTIARLALELLRAKAQGNAHKPMG